jgi:heme/copper-type cytochrome/quinol oxidase subunit 2
VLPISDEFLLTMASVSATVIGLFAVGILFFAQTGFRRLEKAGPKVEPYIRAGTRIVFILFAFPLLLSLTLVALEPA